MSNYNKISFTLTFLYIVFLFTTGCANSSATGCTVSQTTSGSVITCADGTSSKISDGVSGTTGAPGAQGLGSGIETQLIPDGDSRCLQGNGGVEYTTFIDVNNTGIYAANDTITSVNYVCDGATGATGASSMIGLTAANTTDCPSGGWDVSVTNGSAPAVSYPVCNGAVGATGATGATGAAGQNAAVSPLSLVQLIAPCGNASSAWKEELLLFSDGTLLADFSSDMAGDDTRLSLIPDGTYEDTDESGCVFTISTSGSTRSISWAAGSSSAEPGGWAAGGQSWNI